MKNFWKGLRRPFAWMTRMLREPRRRYGWTSTLLFAGFAAVCVLLNIGVEALEKEYGWRKDYSFNAYATTGEETRAVTDRLDKSVDIYLLYQSGQMDEQIMELLNRYDNLSDLIQVKPTDIAKNPGVFARFQGDMDSALAAGSVVVSCDATGRYKVLTDDDFVTLGYNIEAGAFEIAGLAYERCLTEAIVNVTQDEIPVVGILQGHGELTLEELGSLISFLESNHYDCRTVNLLAGETLDEIDLLLFGGPQKDLEEGEVQAIDLFARQGGNMLVMRDCTDPMELPNYFSLLKNYGVEPLDGVAVAGEEAAGSYYGERVYIVPEMCEMDMTLPLILSDQDYLILAFTGAFEAPRDPDSLLTVGTVLQTDSSAYLRGYSDGYEGIERQEGDRTGTLSLALFAHRMHATGNVSRMFAIGNSALFTEEYMYQRTFNQEFIMQLMGELLPQSAVSLDIMASAAFHPELRAGNKTLGIALILAGPMITLVTAVTVLQRRRKA